MSSSRARCQAARAPNSAHAHKPPSPPPPSSACEGLELERMERMERMEPQGEVGLGVPEDQPAPSSSSRQAWSRDNPGFEPEDGLDANWSPGRRSLSDTSSSGGSSARIHRGLYPTPPADGLHHEPPSLGARMLEKIRRNAKPSYPLPYIYTPFF